MTNIKYIAIANTIIVISGCVCVSVATYIIQNPICLLGLLFINQLTFSTEESKVKNNSHEIKENKCGQNPPPPTPKPNFTPPPTKRRED